MIVTIDGPAGSGKSTAARQLAKQLGFRFLDTGAMYRTVALACLEQEIPETDTSSVTRLAGSIEISFRKGRVYLDQRDVTEEIRTARVTEFASKLAMISALRQELVEQQRRIASTANFVTEGRDQGTVAFPRAECKFFLTADSTERAKRRMQEAHGEDAQHSLEEVRAQIEDRDRRDQTRAVAPLLPAPDAVEIDTSQLTIAEVVQNMARIVEARQSDN